MKIISRRPGVLAFVLVVGCACAWKPLAPLAANSGKLMVKRANDSAPGGRLADSSGSGKMLDSEGRRKLAVSYARLPLSFEANTGQTDPQVKFTSRGAGYTLFLTGNQAVLALKSQEAGDKSQEARDERPEARDGSQEPSGKRQEPIGERQERRAKSQEAKGHGQRTKDAVLRMSLIGGNPNAEVTGLDEFPGKANYFVGNDPAKWHSNVATYAKVKYESVYPGVDLVYYGNQGRLEYDFVVAPGADPRAIALNVAAGLSRQGRKSGGIKPSLRVDGSGDLVVSLEGSEVSFHKPLIYQPAATPNAELRTEKLPVEGNYRLTGHQVKFEVGKYDHTRPLVIDPALTYSTYLGGSNESLAQAIATDASGNVYVTGYTYSTDFPVTSGAFQTKFSGAQDVFVSKLNPAGSSLAYSTYLGGASSQAGYGIAVNGSGEAYVSGYTYSADFPATPGAFQTQLAGQENAFVSKLNDSGSALVYSTYVGGADYDSAAAIAIDRAGDAYVIGWTKSPNFPNTPGVIQNSCNASYCYDAFVTELNPNGSALVYSTFLGGTGGGAGTGVAVDSSGSAYVTGWTYSYDFPVTPGAFQRGIAGYQNAVISKLNPGASQLVYSTYLGGYNYDTAAGIAVDSAGNAYVAGATSSNNFPVTTGAFQTSAYNGAGFVTKLNTEGTALVYSTFLGGGGFCDIDGCGGDSAAGVSLDSAGDAYVTGKTVSINFPVTLGSFDPKSASNCDTWVYGEQIYCTYAYMTELNPSGSALVYSTYLGSGIYGYDGYDSGTAIAVNAAGKVFLAGVADDDAYFPATPGAYQTTFAGYEDAFISIFSPSPNAGLSPASLSFPLQETGTTSSTQTVVLTNTGNLSMNLTSIAFKGAAAADFAQTNNCGSSLAVGVNCSINVSFAPRGTGTRTASLAISDTAPASPQTVPVIGQGTSAFASLSPSSLVFPTQVVYTTSKAKKVTLTNTGIGALTITSITATHNFIETNNCGSTIKAKAGCAIDVTFDPTAAGTLTISITDNAPGSPQVISLSGTGNDIELSPTKLNFGTVSVGATSPVKTISVENKSTTSVSVTSIAITGTGAADFAETNNCGSSLVPGEICTVSVTFSPTATGSLTANVTITDNGGASPQTVALSGTGD